jgi:hypothetical protein
MNDGTWAELLTELISATQAGEIRWKPTDARGSFIAPFGGTSVIVRGVSTEIGLAALAVQVFNRAGVELRDVAGNVVAAVGAGIGFAMTPAQVGSMGDEPIVTYASDHLQHLVDQLADAIRITYISGEHAAREIIDELRSRRS